MATDDGYEPCCEELMANNAAFDSAPTIARLGGTPSRRLAIVTCMDSRVDPFEILGLHNGEAHILRNAGGVVTDDVMRSLCLSQRQLGTREILLIHHSDCGLQKTDPDAFVDELERDSGQRPPWDLEAFDDPYDDVGQSIERLRGSPFLTHKDHIRGFVYDVDTGLLNEVAGDGQL